MGEAGVERFGVGAHFAGVVERGPCWGVDGLVGIATLQGELDEAVGEVGVLGKERAVQVGAKGVAQADAFRPIAAVVAETGDDFGKRLGLVAEVGASAVVFEADEGFSFPQGDDVADTALEATAGVNGDGVEDGGEKHHLNLDYL